MEQTDLQGMLGALTQNPDLMEKLRKIATGLATANTPQVSSPQPAPPVTATEIAPLHLFGDFSARKQLLCALRPYLHEKRRKKLDDILNLLCLLEAAERSGILSQFLTTLKEKQDLPHVSS